MKQYFLKVYDKELWVHAKNKREAMKLMKEKLPIIPQSCLVNVREF